MLKRRPQQPCSTMYTWSQCRTCFLECMPRLDRHSGYLHTACKEVMRLVGDGTSWDAGAGGVGIALEGSKMQHNTFLGKMSNKDGIIRVGVSHPEPLNQLLSIFIDVCRGGLGSPSAA